MKPANEKLFYYALLVYSFGMLASILIPGTFEEVGDAPSTAASAMGPPVIAAVCSENTAMRERGTRPPEPGAMPGQEIVTEPCGLPIEGTVRTLVAPSADGSSHKQGAVTPQQPTAMDDLVDQSL